MTRVRSSSRGLTLQRAGTKEHDLKNAPPRLQWPGSPGFLDYHDPSARSHQGELTWGLTIRCCPTPHLGPSLAVASTTPDSYGMMCSSSGDFTSVSVHQSAAERHDSKARAIGCAPNTPVPIPPLPALLALTPFGRSATVSFRDHLPTHDTSLLFEHRPAVLAPGSAKDHPLVLPGDRHTCEQAASRPSLRGLLMFARPTCHAVDLAARSATGLISETPPACLSAASPCKYIRTCSSHPAAVNSSVTEMPNCCSRSPPWPARSALGLCHVDMMSSPQIRASRISPSPPAVRRRRPDP